ncbi:XdhC family protein [Pararhizobium sp. DWP3-4]|uniref:XdhC family protein n=1 Tax=Pararhizobium sp. DWP3-4 TaxID=2804565 RepID=UPI003CE78804
MASSLLEPDYAAPQAAMLTDDAIDILKFACASFTAGHGTALITLIGIRGGAARALGAQMAVRADGLYCGYVSGGCTEAALAAEAVLSIVRGVDRNVMLGVGSPFFDIVLPCDGGITVSIHVLNEIDVLFGVIEALQKRQRISLTYDPASQRICSIGAGEVTGSKSSLFLRQFRPRLRLHLGGNSLETTVVARVASAAGFEVFVCDQASEIDATHWDSDSAVALLFHDVEKERALLERALASSCFYIGALGSKRTHAQRCDALRVRGHGEGQVSRIKGPIGLFSKARDSTALALSILADITLVRQLDEYNMVTVAD